MGAKRDPGIDEGATTVAYLEDKGWFWNIPLKDDIVSSGIVAERDYLYRKDDEANAVERDLAKIYEREVAKNPWIAEHLGEGEQFGEYWVTGEYSYRAEHCATDGLVLVGDAFAFLDPVFSSGVYLALKTGELAADTIASALEKGTRHPLRANVFKEYGETVCQGIEWMRNLVYAFYDPDFRFKDVAMQSEPLRNDLTDCLIGDLMKRDYTELFQAVGKYAELPEPLPHGRAPLSEAV